MPSTIIPQADWDLVRNTPEFKSGRKFDLDSLVNIPVLQGTAETYAEHYQGTFGFMLEMQDAYLRRGRLSAGQAKGVLNCMAAEIRRADAAKAQAQPAAALRVVGEVPVGYFTVRFEDGTHSSIRISKARGQDGRNAPGVFNLAFQVGAFWARFGKVEQGSVKLWKAGFIYGDDNKYAVPGRAEESVRLLLAAQDVSEYGKAYATSSGSCWMCGKLLTDPESIDRGIGPECSRKGYQKGKGQRAAETKERIALKGGRSYRDVFEAGE